MIGKTLITRALLTRNVINVAKTIQAQSVRNGGHGSWAYRAAPERPSKRALFLAELFSGLCWYWILYHIITEHEHIYGEWKWVSPSSWTDKELGIPPVGTVAKVE